MTRSHVEVDVRKAQVRYLVTAYWRSMCCGEVGQPRPVMGSFYSEATFANQSTMQHPWTVSGGHGRHESIGKSM